MKKNKKKFFLDISSNIIYFCSIFNCLFSCVYQILFCWVYFEIFKLKVKHSYKNIKLCAYFWNSIYPLKLDLLTQFIDFLCKKTWILIFITYLGQVITLKKDIQNLRRIFTIFSDIQIFQLMLRPAPTPKFLMKYIF